MGNEESNGIHSEFPMDVKLIKFINLGNTCYLNSILQALLNSDYISEYVDNFIKITDDKEDLTDKIKESLLFDFITIYKAKKESKSRELLFNPSKFSDNLTKTFPQFTKGVQHDSHELFITLLDSFDSIIFEINKKHSVNLSLVSSLTHGSSRTTSQCLMCGTKTETTEEFETFFISIKERISLTYKIRTLHEPEYMCGQGKRKCNICNIAQEMKSVTEYVTIPPIIVFQMQRFEYNKETKRLKKLKEHVPFPSSLILKGKKYQLKSVVVHIGDSLAFGHFICLLRVCEKWILSNDSSLELHDDIEIEEYFAFGNKSGKPTPTAYLLFYELKK